VRVPHVSDPGRFALRAAIRAAVVVSATFAFAHFVIDDNQVELFAAFGSISLLVMLDFSGPRRVRLLAYVVLGLASGVLIALGTLAATAGPVVGALAMFAVGLAILLAGVINGYLAAASFGALLTFVLPVMIPSAVENIPDRLAGYGLAWAVAVPTVMLWWPKRPPSALREASASACRALAALVREPTEAAVTEASDAVDAVRQRFLSTPYRPTGSSGATGAAAALVDELGWLRGVAGEPDFAAPAPARAMCVEALEACAERLDHRGPDPDPAPLQAALDEDAVRLRERLAALARGDDEQALRAALRAGFDARILLHLSLRILRLTHLARGGRVPGESHARVAATLLRGHASMRSVWLRNSIRGAVALALAVFVALELSVQRAFWVVLATMTVMRSSALSTGSTAIRAFAGTTVGIVVGGLLVWAIGDHTVLLWIALPIAVALGAYAPKAISFAAGQAAFTIVVLVLFNLISPVGWEVGLVRITDVAIGFAISLAVGLLLWPRGAVAVLRDAIAEGYTRGAAHATAAFERVFSGGSGTSMPVLAAESLAAQQRLDAAFRQALDERGSGRLAVIPTARLLAGAVRLRLAAEAVDSLALRCEGVPRGDAAKTEALSADARQLGAWYDRFAQTLIARTAPPPLDERTDDGMAITSALLRAAAATADEARFRAALASAWGDGYLDELGRMRERVVRADERAIGELSG
jgi:uncharacterized membrane protein YccC